MEPPEVQKGSGFIGNTTNTAADMWTPTRNPSSLGASFEVGIEGKWRGGRGGSYRTKKGKRSGVIHWQSRGDFFPGSSAWFWLEDEERMTSADVVSALTGGSHLLVAEEKKGEPWLGCWVFAGCACWAGPVGLARLAFLFFWLKRFLFLFLKQQNKHNFWLKTPNEFKPVLIFLYKQYPHN